MKKKSFVILFVVAVLLPFFQDWLWVQTSWQLPPTEPLIGPEVEEIHKQIRDLQQESLPLTEVRLRKHDFDDPRKMDSPRPA